MMQQPIKEVEKGFQQLAVSDVYKKEALKNIEQWLTSSEFKDYQGQILHLIKNKMFDLLLDSFYQVIPFGTGGRRGPVGIGTNRINPWTIKASAQGHAAYLLKKYPDAKDRGIVIAYDVRKYPPTGIYDDTITNPVKGVTSKELAMCAADVYTANGIKIYFFKEIRTTPELSFAIRRLRAVAGVNISASHNPKEDNGKKVYAEDGGQLLPPDDQILSDMVNAVKKIIDTPDPRLLHHLGEEMDKEYLAETAKQTLHPQERKVSILFSPLHGVGTTNVYATLSALGFNVALDPLTKDPDGLFTNVKFNIPNPEVPESFETCYKAAKKTDIILATDPDADRMGISVMHKGQWHYLNGNQIGTVVLSALLDALHKKEKLPEQGVVVKTVVTTSLLNKICGHYNVKIIDDLLVGFKYIAHEIAKLEKQGRESDFIMGLEESHGYLIGTYCRDKDGVCASVVLAELAAMLKRKKQTIIDYLEEIYQEYGYADNALSLLTLEGAMGMEKMLGLQAELRKNVPQKLGTFNVAQFIDRWDGPKHLSATDTASRNVLIFHFVPPQGVETLRAVIRPSGTQPSIKLYIEAIGEKETPKETVIEGRKELRKAFLKHVYQILQIDMPERGYLLSDLLPVSVKVRYFEIEKELLALKKAGQATKEKIDDLLKPFGKDPIEKIDSCFQAQQQKGFREFFWDKI